MRERAYFQHYRLHSIEKFAEEIYCCYIVERFNDRTITLAVLCACKIKNRGRISPTLDAQVVVQVKILLYHNGLTGTFGYNALAEFKSRRHNFGSFLQQKTSLRVCRNLFTTGLIGTTCTEYYERPN